MELYLYYYVQLLYAWGTSATHPRDMNPTFGRTEEGLSFPFSPPSSISKVQKQSGGIKRDDDEIKYTAYREARLEGFLYNTYREDQK